MTVEPNEVVSRNIIPFTGLVRVPQFTTVRMEMKLYIHSNQAVGEESSPQIIDTLIGSVLPSTQSVMECNWLPSKHLMIISGWDTVITCVDRSQSLCKRSVKVHAISFTCI